MAKVDKRALQIKELKGIKDRFTLAGKKAFVTGAAGGIGRTTAAALADLGADVALVDVNVERAQQNAADIAERYGVKALALYCDVSSESSVKDMVQSVLKEFGAIDIVHSNAGIGLLNDNVDMPLSDWQKMIDINLTGMFLVDQTVAHWMRDNNRPGSIINTASMSGSIINRPAPGTMPMLCYCVAKYGVIGLTKAMAMGFAENNIRFNSISPGYLVSGLHDPLPDQLVEAWCDDVPIKRFATLDEIGGLVAFLASDLSSYMNGADVIIDGGYTCW